MKQWVNYIRIWNPTKHGGAGGYDKPPINPFTLWDGKTTDSAVSFTKDFAITSCEPGGETEIDGERKATFVVKAVKHAPDDAPSSGTGN